MDYWIFIEVATFWMLLLACMAFATYMFIGATQEYAYDVSEYGATFTAVMNSVVGFFSIGLPVIQGGLWLHYNPIWAWAIVLCECLIAIVILFAVWRDA